MKDVQMSSLTVELQMTEREKISLLLDNLAITKPEIAAIIGISYVSVCNYLSGRNAKRSRVPLRIKDYLSKPKPEQEAELATARLRLNR